MTPFLRLRLLFTGGKFIPFVIAHVYTTALKTYSNSYTSKLLFSLFISGVLRGSLRDPVFRRISLLSRLRRPPRRPAVGPAAAGKVRRRRRRRPAAQHPPPQMQVRPGGRGSPSHGRSGPLTNLYQNDGGGQTQGQIDRPFVERVVGGRGRPRRREAECLKRDMLS